ncbi:MAG: gas vesicle protein GvpN [Merismopedia sp. SIO2A8]|nr:gas vesicle protein GvpN [Merismopedia sp. SIO2A8]
MTTVLKASSSESFVETPAINRLTERALRYLNVGFSVHLRGPAGTGKTTLALHLANMLSRPILLMFGDDEYKSSDLIGNQQGYNRRKVVDNFIHTVVKIEDEVRQSWEDAHLTTACREGFTLVYDEFNRSRPEVNNVLLSALEERLLVLPSAAHQQQKYIRTHPDFRVIFTSNPEEYCGVHETQDALMDRLVTIDLPEPDQLTQQEIVVQKTGLERAEAGVIVNLVRQFRERTGTDKSSGLRACLIIAKVCYGGNVPVSLTSDDFRDVCRDILLSRSKQSRSESIEILAELLQEVPPARKHVPLWS